MDREKVIKALHDARRYLEDKEWSDRGASPHIDAINDTIALLKDYDTKLQYRDDHIAEYEKEIKRLEVLLKEQEVPEELKHRMWNALYAEEDRFEKKFIGTDAHDAWSNIYRPWLQRGFEIAIKVIAHWEDPVRYERNGKKPTLVWPVSPNRNTENRCVVCGAVIPEGRYVCPNCESGDIQED